MPGAVIVIDQNTGAGPGTPGVARNDLWELQEVTLHVGTTGNTTYQWDLLNRPAGSIAEIVDPLSETATFVPDMVGTYRLRLVVNGGGAGNVQILVARVRYDSTGALKNRGWAYPAVGEQEGENNYPGNERSWSQIVEYILEDIRVNGMGGGGSITLGGDLGAWSPPSSDHQRVVGLNTVPLPVDLPTNRDFIRASAPTMISRFVTDLAFDGTNVWVADPSPVDGTDNPLRSTAAGGLARAPAAGTVFDLRFDFEASPGGLASNCRPYSVAYLAGDLFMIHQSMDGEMIQTWIAQIDPAGTVPTNYLAEASLSNLGQVRAYNGKLWHNVPHPTYGMEEAAALYVIDPNDLTSITTVRAPGIEIGPTATAYDPTNNLVWFMISDVDEIRAYDADTLTESVISPLNYPGAGTSPAPLAIAATDNALWVVYSVLTGFRTSAEVWVYHVDTATWTQADLLGVALTFLSVAWATYDNTTDKFYFTVDRRGSPSPLFEIDGATETMTKGATLGTYPVTSVLSGGGYEWVLDAPSVGGGSPMPLLKVDPALMENMPSETWPWPGVIARIVGGAVSYEFTKNTRGDTVDRTALGGYVSFTIATTEETSLCMGTQLATLPTGSYDGERHTVVDAVGDASIDAPLSIAYSPYYWNIANPYGSKTFHWSEALNNWIEV